MKCFRPPPPPSSLHPLPLPKILHSLWKHPKFLKRMLLKAFNPPTKAIKFKLSCGTLRKTSKLKVHCVWNCHLDLGDVKIQHDSSAGGRRWVGKFNFLFASFDNKSAISKTPPQSILARWKKERKKMGGFFRLTILKFLMKTVGHVGHLLSMSVFLIFPFLDHQKNLHFLQVEV